MLQRVAVCQGSVLRCVALCEDLMRDMQQGAMQCVAGCSVLQVAVRCRLQCVACCSVLQVAVSLDS